MTPNLLRHASQGNVGIFLKEVLHNNKNEQIRTICNINLNLKQKQPDMNGCIACNSIYMVINKVGKTKS